MLKRLCLTVMVSNCVKNGFTTWVFLKKEFPKLPQLQLLFQHICHTLLHNLCQDIKAIDQKRRSKNLAFIGNFAETPRDTVFTTEYSVRTAMKLFTLLISTVAYLRIRFAFVRMLMNAMYYLNDQKKLEDLIYQCLRRVVAIQEIKGNYVEELMKYKLI